MNLCIVTTTWKRHDLTRQFLEFTAERAEALDVGLVCVGSEGDLSRKMAEEAGWRYLDAPNNPVSGKWHAGIADALANGADAVMILGSDDFATAEVIQTAIRAMEDGVDLWGPSDFFFCGDGPRAAYWGGYTEAQGRVGEPMGAARTFSRRLLVRLGGVLWPEPLDRGLDGAAWDRIKQFAQFDDVRIVTQPIRTTGGMLVDVKRNGEEQISPLQRYFDTGSEEIDWRTVTRHFPADVVEGWGLDPSSLFHSRVLEASGLVEEPRNAKVGLAMIARNSARTIERAIRCAMPIIGDLVVVVDEKTTDDTGSVADRLGATVHQRAWPGFAAQRNYAHSLLRADWHLVLDADETLELGDLPEAIERADKADADAIMVTTLGWSAAGVVVPQRQARVLRSGRTNWVYRRHNEVIGITKHVDSTAVVRNSYVGRMDEIAKAAAADLLEMYERPIETLVSHDEERAHAALHLARSHLVMGNWAEARDWAARVETLTKNEVKIRFAQVQQAWVILMLEGPDACETYCRSLSDAANGQLAEAHYLIGSVRMAKWYMAALAPGQFALIPQRSLAYAGNFPQAARLMGFPVSVTYEAEGEAK